MNDTISRREALDIVEHITSSMSICLNEDECHGMKRMQQQVILELANMPPAREWIPCSEHLPKVREWVLCQCRAGIMDVLRLTEDGYWNKNYPHAEYMSGFVIAWMPLPQPYREGEKDTDGET